MKKDDRSLPKDLKGFVPRPAPPHLRLKVLAAAAAVRPAERFLTAAQWGMAAASAVLIIGALAGDAVLSRTMTGRLDAVLSERPADSLAAVAERAGLEEILGAAQARALYAPSARPRQDPISRMEGRGNWDESALVKKEGADVHTKNPQ
jgi:hypothetical protein